MKTAWLIGAGFSYEFGMPLVWELTESLFGWLTPAKLRELNQGWKRQGSGHPDALIEEYASVIDGAKLHYEELIGWLQRESVKPHRHREREHLRHLAELLSECVALLLVRRHGRHLKLFKQSLPWFAGMADHVEEQGQLWIFSLNHDVCVEMLGAELGIDVSCGYERGGAAVLTSDGRERLLDRLTRERIVAGTLDFGPPERRGINLVKLHGSLDVFGYDDLKSYVRLAPTSPGADGWVESLQSADRDLHALETGRAFRVTNEICTRDAAGVIQFLQRTNVVGALKFDRQMSHTAPAEFLAFFGRKLDDFDELAVIGYGWGDAHVNRPIEQWLARRPDARLVVVNPAGLPAGMEHLADRCDVRQVPAAEYVSARRWTSFSNEESLRRRLRLIARRDPASFFDRFPACMEELQREQVRKIVSLYVASRGGTSEAELLAQAPTVESTLKELIERLESVRA